MNNFKFNFDQYMIVTLQYFFLVKNDLNLFFGCKIFLITLKYKNY